MMKYKGCFTAFKRIFKTDEKFIYNKEHKKMAYGEQKESTGRGLEKSLHHRTSSIVYKLVNYTFFKCYCTWKMPIL